MPSNSGTDQPKVTTCNNTSVALLEMARGDVVWQEFDDSCEAKALELLLCLVMFDTMIEVGSFNSADSAFGSTEKTTNV